MTTRTTVTLDLPSDVYHRMATAALAMHRPVADLLMQSITGNLPPVFEDAPSTQRAEFAAMQQLDDQVLWQIVGEQVDSKLWRRHKKLLAKNDAGVLTVRETSELEQLRDLMDRFVLRRSFALALLKWRGHSLAPVLAKVVR